MAKTPYRIVLLLVALVLGNAAAQVLPRDVRQQILRSVVQVQAFDVASDRVVGAGSGTIVGPYGHVLTSFHVVAGPGGVPVEWQAILTSDPYAPDREPTFRYWARFVAGDAGDDLAILRIVALADETPIPEGVPFAYATIGDSTDLIPGDPITVVGYPGISGDTITFTSGIVSGFLGEDLSAGGQQWIKTDAKLARGNSGGAAFDENGLLIGIPTLRTQTRSGAYVENQDYLRPISLAWPLIRANVPGVVRAGGPGDEVADAHGPEASGADPPLGPRGSVPPTGQPPTPPTFETHRSSRVERGTLGPGDLALDSGEYLDIYRFAMRAGVPVDVEIVSDEIDPYLLILDPDERVVLDVDDSAGAGVNVSERFWPSVDGDYVVAITSAFGGEVGTYELRVAGASMPSDDVATVGGEASAFDGSTASEAAASEVRTGTLGPGDDELPSGEFVDSYTFEFHAGDPLRLTLTSSAFDPYLAIVAPSGTLVLAVDDSAGAGLGVDETFVPALDGPFEVLVTSSRPREAGSYELRIRAENGAEAGATEGGVADDGSDGAGSDGAGSDGDGSGSDGSGSDGFSAPRSLGTASGIVGDLRLGQRTISTLAGASEAWAFHTYRIEVPPGAALLSVQLKGDADLDLFLKYGSEIASYAEDGDWQYRDIGVAHEATLSIRAPRAGVWYVDVAWAVGDPAQVASYVLRAD